MEVGGWPSPGPQGPPVGVAYERPRHARPQRSAGERLAAAAAAFAGLGLVVVGAVMSISSGDDAKHVVNAVAPAPDEPALRPDASPEDVFAAAAERIEDAGTFTYDGTTRIEGTDPAADELVVVDRELRGEVRLPNDSHELVDEPDGSLTERIAVSSSVWTRTTAFPEQIEARPWQNLGTSWGELDLHRLGSWLTRAADHRDGGEDRHGDRVAHAQLAPNELGAMAQFLDVVGVALTLTVDARGEPTTVVVELTTGVGFAATSTYELDDLGEPVDIVAVDGPIDRTPFINEEDITVLGGPPLIGLGGVPTGWTMSDAGVALDPAGACDGVEIGYTDPADPVRGYLWITVLTPDCVDDPPGGQPFSVGPYAGAAIVEDAITDGVVRDATAAVTFTTDLSLDDLAQVLATLGPLDLAETPDPIEDIPSSPA